MKSKSYWINAKERTITEVPHEGAADLQKMVEGYIELATYFQGDTLYVNEEGMYNFDYFFTIEGGHQPFAGNGVLVGKEIGDTANTRPPKSTLAEVTSAVKFYTRAEVRRMVGA